MKTRFIVSLALTLGLLTAPAALAHTVLIGSNPGAGTTVAQLPEAVTLTFANPLLTLGKASVNEVQVTDPMGMQIASGDNVVRGAVLSSVLRPAMVMSGTYRVAFRVAAQDGHVITGSFNFEVGASGTAKLKVKVPKSGLVVLHATATGKGVLDGVGSPTDVASGTFTINFGDDSLCYLIKTKIGGLTAAHVHAASQKNMTISDEIYLPLQLASVNALKPVCQKADGVSLATLAQNSTHYVFMLHSRKYPNGDVAGSLKK